MKKCLSLALLAMFAILPFSCSNEGFKEPMMINRDGIEHPISDTREVVTCVVEKEAGSKYCYEISKSACDIIKGTADSNETCINFTCKWDLETVKYGRNSTLSFDLDSAGHENCSWKISYGNKELDTESYTISSSAFPGLSHSKDTSIVAIATVTCGEQQYKRNCSILRVEHVAAPEARCNWKPSKVKYGGKSALSFAFESESIAQEENCALEKISYGNKELDTESYTISSSAFPGLSHSKDTSIVAIATVTCGNQDKWKYELDCEELEIDSVPGPKWTGTLSFKKPDYVSNDTNYFFIGTRVDDSYIESTIEITNKDEAECGNIEIRISGSPARSGTPVKAIAVVNCKYTGELKLDSISAEVLPDPVIKECTLGDNSQYYMHRGESLTLNVTLDDISGRCNNGIRYSLNGTTYSTSLSLSSSSGKLSSIKARAECSGNFTTPSVSCPEIFVAEGYIGNARCNHESIFESNINVTKATTVIEYACCEPKNDYFITCDGSKSYNFKIQGAPDVTSSNGDANLPDLTPIPESNAQCTRYGDSPGGTLYRYPKRILMTVTNGLGGGFSCDSW